MDRKPCASKIVSVVGEGGGAGSSTRCGHSNATIADGQGVGTITNDDGVPSLSIDDVTVTEGNAGQCRRLRVPAVSATVLERGGRSAMSV